MNENIKWIALQPLLGGMYLATENAVGHPAECIISFHGNDKAKLKNGKVISAHNEYHLLQYLKEHNRLVPYYKFDKDPFQSDYKNINVKILEGKDKQIQPDYSNIDLVVALPVCSGLSNSTIASSKDALMSKNYNMLFLANYTLSVIKPKVYIFENAPTLLADKGKCVRNELESIARDNNYSVAYYKTNTMLHDNCQNRPRTFVYFFKRDDNIKGVPELQFENKQISVEELLNRIPKNDNDTMNVTLKLKPVRQALYDYLINNESDLFRKILTSAHVLDVLYRDNKLRDFEKYIVNNSQYSESFKKRISDYINIIYNKRSQNKNFWHEELNVIKDDIMPACMHRTMESVLHYKENRLYTLREWLTTMGMPFDFKLYGDILKVYKQIGQSVPVRTMQFIVNQAVDIINNWNTIKCDNVPVMYYNNINQTANTSLSI